MEVAKLGARPVSFDINPVATLVQRQALRNWNRRELEANFRKVEHECRDPIEALYRSASGETVLYYFWVATARCLTCTEAVHLFDSPVYAKNANPKARPSAQLVCPRCLDVQGARYDFSIAYCARGHRITRRGPVSGREFTCSHGHASRVTDALRGAPPKYTMYAKMILRAQRKRAYEAVDDWDRQLYDQCVQELPLQAKAGVMPTGQLTPGNNTNQALRWNCREWTDFFNHRQLLALSYIATSIRDLSGYSPEREAMATLFSGTLEFNNMFASFKGEGTGAVRHMFSHHVLRPERTPLEAHVWGTPSSSGAFSTLFTSRIGRANAYKEVPTDLVLESGTVVRRAGLSRPLGGALVEDWNSFCKAADPAAYVRTCDSAVTDLPDASVDLVVTDPPYMDNVHYAELADFFHAWLTNIRPFESYPVEDTTRQKGEVQDADARRFGAAIEGVWSECARVVKPGGLLVFTFHQARISGWIEIIEAARRAGWQVTAVQPIKGEMSSSVVKTATREPSNLDSVVVCRRIADSVEGGDADLPLVASLTVDRLRALATAGVTVGLGDVRSVMRGALLSALAARGHRLSAAAPAVDDEVERAIAAFAEPA